MSAQHLLERFEQKVVCGMEARSLFAGVGQPAFKLLFTPRAAEVLVLLEQLFKSLKIYLLDTLQPCLFGNELYGKSVGGKELKGVSRRQRPTGGKTREFLHPPLQSLPEARL